MSFTPCFDAISTNVRTLPHGQHAGYTTGGGYIQWTTPQWHNDPGALRICQDFNGTDSTADVFDIESGGGSPAKAADWAVRAHDAYVKRVRPGQRQPCVYSAGGTLSAIANAISAAKLAFPVYLWLAKPGISMAEAQAEVLANPGGVLPMVGVQFAWPGYGFPANGTFDESAFLASWLTTQSGQLGDTVSVGNSGPAVVALQKLLRAKDPALAITADGLFGPGTQTAVETYQRLQHLTPDGVVGPATWQSLSKLPPPPVKPPVPPKPPVPVPPPPPKASPAPGHLHTALQSSGSTVTFAWSAIAFAPGYHVQVEKTDPKGNWAVVIDTSTKDLSYTNKFDARSKYRWRVATTEAAHEWTAWVGFNTP